MLASNPIKITLARKQIDLKRILALQKLNLKTALTPEQEAEQGFVSAAHTLDTLAAMNNSAASVIAKDGTTLAGYALAMTREYSQSIPLLTPIFAFQDTLVYQGKTLDAWDYIVMGQVCVAEAYRGRKLVDRMYKYFRGCYAIHYPLLVTAISPRNTRSRRVHQRCGFQELGEFHAPDGNSWIVVIWDWRV